jgi:N-acetylmuramic acid 6-phosphate etherase
MWMVVISSARIRFTKSAPRGQAFAITRAIRHTPLSHLNEQSRTTITDTNFRSFAFMQDRGHLMTELRNERSTLIDRVSIADAVAIMNAEDATIPAAVATVQAEVAQAIELVVDAFESGGRLIYVGAGTSGRLGVLDASECPPTFLSDPRMVQGVIAGGYDALRMAIEGAEDHPHDGAAAMDEMQVGAHDVVMGISTGGTTPYVHGALDRARELGAKTIFFACVTKEHVPDNSDVSIRVLVGPEIVTGSTRLKAGTATKLVLNTITTIAMIRIGKVYENLMVDVNTKANKKLVDRGTRMIMTVTDLEREAAGQLLTASGGHVKTALVMHFKSVDRAGAEELLAGHHGRVADIIMER